MGKQSVMTLVEFLQARLGEDELIALAAIDGAPRWQTHYDYRDVKDEEGHYIIQADPQYPSLEQAAHIARHSPARVLRGVEAKRLVIADYLHREAAGDVLERAAVEYILKALCLEYCEHPDYNPSWA
jgi:hypothetical protein